MRMGPFYLVFLFAVGFANLSVAQPPPLLGNVTVMPGQGANFSTIVPILTSAPLQFWTVNGSGLPAGVSITPTYIEPGANRLTLHVEASPTAPLIANKLVDLHAGGSLSAAYRISVSVVIPSPAPCSVPSLSPMDQSTQGVLVSNLTPGCKVEVWAGDGNGLAPIASSLAGASVSRVSLPHHLDPGTVVRVLQVSGTVTTLFTDSLLVENNYVTNRYDNERSGWNPNETILTVDKARGLAKVCEHMVDGPIRAQSLFVQDVDIPGKGKHNVVFVATDADSVWAFDADSCVPNDKGLWVDTAGNPSPRNLVDSASGERAVTGVDLTSAWPAGADPGCAIMLGITATPAVDRTTNTLYVVGLLIKNNKLIYRLHALDITTGHDQPGSPVVISDSTVQFKGVSFNAALQDNRPGLLLDRGVVYVGFGSHCEIGNYHGWVLAFDANIPGSPGFLGQLGVFNTSPTDPAGAGVWQSGLGLAADGDGTIYLATGNGNFDPDIGSYADTVLNLRLPTNTAAKEMEIVSFLQPVDYSTRTNTLDLGYGGPVLLSRPDPGPITVPIVPKRFILAAGQEVLSYLINRDCIGCNGDPRSCLATTGKTCRDDDPNLVVQSIFDATSIYGGAAYYTGPLGTRLYYAGRSLPVQAFTLQWLPLVVTHNGGVTNDRALAAPIPVVSSNHSNARAGILWSVFGDPDTQELSLHAYDADNLTDNLFSLSGQPSLDPVGTPTWSLDIGGWLRTSRNPFQVPTVIHGKVYAGSQDRLAVFAPVNCYTVMDSSGGVVFLCPRIPARPFLQRKLAREWITVTAPAPRVEKDVTYLFDHPRKDGATYRVCFKDLPKSCLPEVKVRARPSQCKTAAGISSPCVFAGNPPWSLPQPRDEKNDSTPVREH